MSSVNEASSLFGSADNSGSDPFDSIGGSASHDAHDAHDSVSDLFGNVPGSQSNDAFANISSEPAVPAHSPYAPPVQPSTQNGEPLLDHKMCHSFITNTNTYRLLGPCTPAERVCSTCCTRLRSASRAELRAALDVRPTSIFVPI